MVFLAIYNLVSYLYKTSEYAIIIKSCLNLFNYFSTICSLLVTKLLSSINTMKNLITFSLFFSLFISSAASAWAQTDLTIRGARRTMPIAVQKPCMSAGEQPRDVDLAQVISRDLEISGFFDVIAPGAFVEEPGRCAADSNFAYSDWSVIGAEGLIKSEIRIVGRDVNVKLFLHDVIKRQVVLGKEYNGDLSFLRPIAHKFANEIMKFFTGTSGVFGTKVIFSTKIGRFKELAIMDMDGSNIRQLTDDKGLAMSASWHPSGREVVYTSFKKRMPDLFVFDVNNRRSRQLTFSEGLEIGAKYDRTGSNFILSRSVEGRSSIVMMSDSGQLLRQITKSNYGIDVSPSWSPDYQKVAFCSNRAGGPQIYTMNSDGSDIKRVSFVTSNYCTSPSWSPDGKKIAFVCRADAGFQLFVSNSDGSDPLQLTSSGDNEDPTWSPDSRYLIFATTFGTRYRFHLALMLADGSVMHDLTMSRGGDTQPNWGPMPSM